MLCGYYLLLRLIVRGVLSTTSTRRLKQSDPHRQHTKPSPRPCRRNVLRVASRDHPPDDKGHKRHHQDLVRCVVRCGATGKVKGMSTSVAQAHSTARLCSLRQAHSTPQTNSRRVHTCRGEKPVGLEANFLVSVGASAADPVVYGIQAQVVVVVV